MKLGEPEKTTAIFVYQAIDGLSAYEGFRILKRIWRNITGIAGIFTGGHTDHFGFCQMHSSKGIVP